MLWWSKRERTLPAGQSRKASWRKQCLNWALKDDRSWKREIKGKGIPGTRNGTRRSPTTMGLIAVSRSGELSSSEAGGKT